jgi:hypothetical protein
MQRLLKLWLICVIALAIPAKGLAAASMLDCGPVHRSSQQAFAAHDHSAHLQHQASGEAGEQTTDTLDHMPTFKCSAYSSCCTAAALPSSALSLDSAQLLDVFTAVAPPAAAAFFTSGPERPPRVFLA